MPTQELGPGLKHIQREVPALLAELEALRKLRRQAEAKVASLDSRLPPDVRQNDTAAIRTEAHHRGKVRWETADIDKRLQRLEKEIAKATADSLIKRAKFLAPMSDIITNDANLAMISTLRGLLEEQTRTRIVLELSRMSFADLKQAFSDALDGRELARLGAIAREIAYRAESDEEARLYRYEIQSKLDTLDAPDLSAVQRELETAGQLREWLSAALAGIQTGEDRGEVWQHNFELKQSGALDVPGRRTVAGADGRIIITGTVDPVSVLHPAA